MEKHLTDNLKEQREKTKKIKTSITLSNWLLKDLLKESKRLNCSKSFLIEYLLLQYFKLPMEETKS